MLTSCRRWKFWATSVVAGVLVCFVGPTLSWAVNIGGRVVPVDQTNNQPSLNIQKIFGEGGGEEIVIRKS